MAVILFILLTWPPDTTSIGLPTPEKAIDSYYQGYIQKDPWLIYQATGPIGAPGEVRPPLIKDYKIISLDTMQVEKFIFLKGDVEAFVEVYFENDSLPPMRIAHILRKIDGEWYNLHHAYMPDENYPDLDPVYEDDFPGWDTIKDTISN